MGSSIRCTDTSARNNILTIKTIYFVITIVIFVLASVIIGFAFYDRLSDQVVVQWSLNLTPTETVTKSRALIFLIPVFQLIIGIILTMVNNAIHSSKIALENKNSRYLDKIIEKRLLSSKLVFYLLILVELLHTFIQYIIFTQNIELTVWAGIIIILIAIISTYYGVKISRIKYPNVDYGWKNDYIYSNSNDASLFVEKRKGIGYTVNFANKSAVLMLSSILVLVVIMILLTAVTLI